MADKDNIERLALLSCVEYDKVRKTEAEEMGVRLTTLDEEVEKARPKESLERPAQDFFNKVDPHFHPVDGIELLNEIDKIIRRFIVCDPEVATATTLWIAFTWFIDNVKVAPIAMITAPEMQCGKTQLLSLIGKLCNRSLLASNISPAAIFRVIEAHEPTLLIDEADSFLKENEEARGILNSGHTRQSAYVIRVVGDNHEPKQFSTWGAKAVCGIGKQAPTLMGRSIVLELRRKLSNEKVERLRHSNDDDFEIIKRKLARYAQDMAAQIESARPKLPEILNDRAQDNWEPLLAIADAVGGDWPLMARNAALKISGKRQNEDNSSARVMLLYDIRSIFENEKGRARIPTEDLLQQLNDMEDRPWPEWSRGKLITSRQVAALLKPYGISPKKMRFRLGTSRGYELGQFADAFERYLDGTEEHVNKNNSLNVCNAGTIVEYVPHEKNDNSLNNKGCSVVPNGEEIDW